MNIKNKRKIRILLVIRWPVGGIRTFIRYVYNNFDPSKYQFTVIAPENPELMIIIEDLKKHDISYMGYKNDVSSARLFILILKATLFGHYDLVHSHGFTAGVYAALPARISMTKHIMTSHDILSSKQFVGFKGLLTRLLLSMMLKLIDVIHSVSNDAQNNLLEFVPSLRKRRENCIAIQNGIEVERFNNSKKRDFRKELTLSDDTFLIGFLGRFMSQKGFNYLVESMEILVAKTNMPKKPIVLAFGYGGFIREDKEYINKKGLIKYFRFLPFTPNIASSLKGLDVIAIPSLWEACPLLPIESMVAGVPVIGTDCIGLREVLKDTPNVMVSAGDSIALANAIENEMKNPSRVQTEAFSNIAAKRFDVKIQAKKIDTLYQEILF